MSHEVVRTELSNRQLITGIEDLWSTNRISRRCSTLSLGQASNIFLMIRNEDKYTLKFELLVSSLSNGQMDAKCGHCRLATSEDHLWSSVANIL